MKSGSQDAPSPWGEGWGEGAMRKRIPTLLCLLTACVYVPSLFAFELQRAAPEFIENEYRFEMTAVLDAPIDEVERILRDYENYPTLDSRILDAKVIERPQEGAAILQTTLRACFGPVCRTVRRIERVEESSHALLATTDPERSDMKFGETRMALAPADEDKTRVTYQTRLQPDFWIPALVARRMMLETLEDATIELFRSVEQQAQQHESRESGFEIRSEPDPTPSN
jgi:hypothetical protein